MYMYNMKIMYIRIVLGYLNGKVKKEPLSQEEKLLSIIQV